MNRKTKRIIYFVFFLLFFISNTFAILDTIVLQHGVNGYYGEKDTYSSGKGYEVFFLVGAC